MADKIGARVCVIGGGVAGCSVLYHLAALGWTDCVLLEGAELTAGSTWHAAGLCTQFHPSARLMRVLQASLDLYARLPADTGQAVGLRTPGSLRLATTAEQLAYFEDVEKNAASVGLPFALVDPTRVRQLWPMLGTEGVLAAAHLPTDGHVDPAGVTMALAAGARRRGAEIRQGCRALSMRRAGGSWQIETTTGPVTADIVVNAAGMWAPAVAEMVGARLPITPMEHQYLVTGPLEVDRADAAELPVLRDPEASFYIREEGPGLLVGPFEPEPVHWATDGVPNDFAGRLLPPDLDRIGAVYEQATERVPALADAAIRRVINGPDGYTPDGRCLMGPVPAVESYFVLAGFSIFGIVFSGGAGRCLAEWIVHGCSSIDVSELDVARFGAADCDPAALIAATRQVYAGEYAVYPVTA